VTVAIPADTVKIIDNVAKFHPRYFKVGGKQISARFDGKKTQSGNLELRHKHSTFACLTF
jgi:hypothetical protein